MIDMVFWAMYALGAMGVTAMALFVWKNICFSKRRKENIEKEGISLIVVARNDVENLRTLVPAIIAQDYPKYELIVVDDRSCDGTASFLSTIQKNYPSVIKTVYVREDTPYPWPGKKFSISMGVKAASYERIVLLDATSRPSSQKWLSAMSEGFDTSVRYVMGANVPKKIKGIMGWLCYVRKFCSAQISYACAMAGYPYSGEMSNLALKKTEFLSSMGYMNTMRIPAGEADFLLQESKSTANTRVVMTDDVFVYTENINSYKTYWKNCVNEAAVWRKSNMRYRICSILPSLWQMFYMAVAIWGMFLCYDTWWYWLLLIVQILYTMTVNYMCAVKMHYSQKVLWAILSDVVMLPVTACVYFIAFLKVPSRWK